jgi:hypothetical protein
LSEDNSGSDWVKDKRQEKKDNNNKEIIVESEPVKPVNPRMQYYADQLEDMAGNTTLENYKQLVIKDEYQMDGIMLKAKKLKPNDIGELRKLTAELPKIDQEKEWDKYIDNMRAQGRLLIDNFTDDLFDNSDFYVLENVITAWRMKHRGFRKL